MNSPSAVIEKSVGGEVWGTTGRTMDTTLYLLILDGITAPDTNDLTGVSFTIHFFYTV
jgi:hypothetical protein